MKNVEVVSFYDNATIEDIEEIDEINFEDCNSQSSLLSLYVKEIVMLHGSYAMPVSQASLIRYLLDRPYEMEKVDRRTVARTCRTLEYFGCGIRHDKRGYWYEKMDDLAA